METAKREKRGYRMDMVSGPLAGKLLVFALPLMLSSLLQLLFNAADVVVVGRFAGNQALAAVGSNTALINLLVNLFVGFSVGANVVVARDLGAGREEEARKSVHTSVTLALFSGIFLTLAGTLLARQLLVWTSSPADVIDLSTLYLRPLYFLAIAGVTNVGLNLIFVICCHMSVAGVALATIISQYISAALVLRCLMGDQGALRLDLRALGLDKRVVRRILQVGLPAGFQGIVFSLSNVVIQSSINSFNSTVIVAGSSASANIEGFVYASMNAFYQTALTFTSQNYGAGQCKRVDRTLFLCQAYVVITGLVLGNLAVFFGPTLAGIYAPGQQAVIAQAVLRLKYVCSLYCICGIMDTMVGILRGLGYSVVPMVVSMIGACGTRLLWVATIFRANPTPALLYLSYPVSWTITAVVHILFFLFIRGHAYAKVKGIHGVDAEEKLAGQA